MAADVKAKMFDIFHVTKQRAVVLDMDGGGDEGGLADSLLK